MVGVRGGSGGGRKRWRRGVCQSPKERLLQLESIFALGISITGLQSSASLIMDGHMALLTHTVLQPRSASSRTPPPPRHGPLVCPQLLHNLFQKFSFFVCFFFM